jgi:probable phosphomutase (TIGR03848 family)
VTVLLLIRHGTTAATGTRLSGRAPGLSLSSQGREQARELVGRLEGVPIAAIYSSTLQRCRETAAPLARARELRVSGRRDLADTDYGEWTDRTIARARRSKLWAVVRSSPSRVRFPGGESLLEVQYRTVEELENIGRDHPRGVVAVFSHADPIRLAIAHLSGAHPDHVERIVVDPASVSVVAMGDPLPRILRVNDTGPLAGLFPRRSGARKVRG